MKLRCAQQRAAKTGVGYPRRPVACAMAVVRQVLSDFQVEIEGGFLDFRGDCEDGLQVSLRRGEEGSCWWRQWRRQ